MGDAQMERLQASLKAAKMSDGGDFIKPGVGVLVVRELKVGTNKNNSNAGYFKAVLQVVSSHKTHATIDPDPPGKVVDFLQLYDQFPDTAGPRTAEFLTALTGNTQEACTSALPTLIGPDQPLKGALIAYSTYEKTTKKGRVLTLPRWENIKQTQEEVAKRKAELNAADASKGKQ
jgi:hypothetical protein